jgi:hypothetical protein
MYRILKEVQVASEVVQVYMLDGLGELLIFDDLSHALDTVNLLNINSDNNYLLNTEAFIIHVALAVCPGESLGDRLGELV